MNATEKALRAALRIALDHIEMEALRISHCKDAALIEDALALPAAEAVTGPSDEGLYACPFCGSTRVSKSMGEKGDGTPWPYVECEDCAACAEPGVWNQRAAPTPAAATTDGAAEVAKPQAGEPAPPNNLPIWDECAMRVANSDFLAKRVSEGGYGPDHDSKTATELRAARADTARQVAEAVAAEREACARCAETVPAWEAAKWIRKRTDMFAAESQATLPADASQYSKPDRAPSEDAS